MTSRIDWGYRVLWLRGSRWGFRVSARVFVVSGALMLVAAVTGAFALCLGDYPLAIAEVAAILTGSGTEFQHTVVWEWRLPIVIAALVFGALLGVGGAVFQSLTRNPLGSPDVIGFDAGSYTAVVVTVLVMGQADYVSLASSSLLGGLCTASLVYLLAYRGGMQGFRLVVVGIGISAVLGSVNAYLITRADITDAMMVGFWGAGTISRITWSSMLPSLALALLIGVLAAVLSPALRRLELGDDTATTQGTPVGRTRLALLAVGVAATSVVTAATGPIGFVALAAPQLANRLVRSGGASVLAAACMGAALLSCAHLAALAVGQAFRPVPVGLVTVCLGGMYLIWLLAQEARRQYRPARR